MILSNLIYTNIKKGWQPFQQCSDKFTLVTLRPQVLSSSHNMHPYSSVEMVCLLVQSAYTTNALPLTYFMQYHFILNTLYQEAHWPDKEDIIGRMKQLTTSY